MAAANQRARVSSTGMSSAARVCSCEFAWCKAASDDELSKLTVHFLPSAGHEERAKRWLDVLTPSSSPEARARFHDGPRLGSRDASIMQKLAAKVSELCPRVNIMFNSRTDGESAPLRNHGGLTTAIAFTQKIAKDAAASLKKKHGVTSVYARCESYVAGKMEALITEVGTMWPPTAPPTPRQKTFRRRTNVVTLQLSFLTVNMDSVYVGVSLVVRAKGWQRFSSEVCVGDDENALVHRANTLASIVESAYAEDLHPAHVFDAEDLEIAVQRFPHLCVVYQRYTRLNDPCKLPGFTKGSGLNDPCKLPGFTRGSGLNDPCKLPGFTKGSGLNDPCKLPGFTRGSGLNDPCKLPGFTKGSALNDPCKLPGFTRGSALNDPCKLPGFTRGSALNDPCKLPGFTRGSGLNDPCKLPGFTRGSALNDPCKALAVSCEATVKVPRKRRGPG
ncbi:hypothetical protein NFJ02_42g109290 [Pycnococcus provasolii]